MADKTETATTPNPARPTAAAADLTKPEPAQNTHHTTHATAAHATVAPAAAPKPAGPPVSVDERYFELAEFKQNRFFAIARTPHTVEDVLAPTYWAHVANSKLQPGNIIGVLWEDRSKYLEAVVFQVGVNWAAVSLRGEITLPPVGLDGKSMLTDFEIKNLGEIKKWSVVRRSDGSDIITGQATQDAAARALAEYIRTTVGLRAA
jgi:hypothetical protein